jgi:ribosomal protein L32
MRLAHHVCRDCGYYGTGTASRKVITVAADKPSEEA